MSDRDYVAIANKYATDVTTGKISACRWIKLACKRHLDNVLESEGNPLYAYEFNAEKANHICMFAEKLPHVKGKWARATGKDRLIKLSPWQVFCLAVLFGWLRRGDGLRRFRKAYICVPRKNGKSVLAAIVGLYLFAVDREPGAEVFSGAGTEKQAWEIFGPARKMVERTPAFRQKFGIQVNAKSLMMPREGSKFEPIIGTPGDGSSPSCALIDEYHEHKTDALYDTMVTGMGAREHPLAFIITTAGSNIAGPCYAHELDVKRVLEGIEQDEESFALIYGVDDESEWNTDAGIYKANPNIDVSVFADYLRSQVQGALRSPRKQNTIKQKHFNIWTSGADGWMSMSLWNKAGNESLSMDDFKADECWDGLDLASKVDIASRVRIYRRNENGAEHYYCFGRHYVPESVMDDDEKKHYHEWVRGGYLIATDGNVIDHTQILDDIKADVRLGQLQDTGYDQYNGTMLATLATEDGIPMTEVPQTTKYLSEPMKWITALLEDGRFHHDNNPAMNWMVSNVTAKEDRNENLFPRKEVPEQKIDGAVAMITAMASALAMSEPEVNLDSFLKGPTHL